MGPKKFESWPFFDLMQRRQQGHGAEELGHAGSGFVESTERAMACAVRLIDARRREKVGIRGEDVLVVLHTMLVLVVSLLLLSGTHSLLWRKN